MKTISEILGGAQILLGISYDLQDSFEEYLNDDHRAFLAMLRVLEQHLPPPQQVEVTRGRKPVAELPMIRCFFAKAFFRIGTTTDLIKRLRSDATLRQICGFTVVPSPATFSRRQDVFARRHIMEQTLQRMVREYHAGILVCHVSRDSTAIAAREKPVNRKRDVRPPQPRKRGRPKKGELRAPKKPARLARQRSMPAGKALSELDKKCSWGSKRNSQGNIQFWKGYKLHLDVTDAGVPVTAVVTGANVHDSQLAIPMEKRTQRSITHLYSLMDAAYDAAEIATYINATGRVALIDRNKRRNDPRAPFDPASSARFKIRSTVERSNAHLKDWLLPDKLTVRGHSKVTFCLMCGVVCLAAIKILQHMVLPSLQQAAAA